MTAVMRAAVIGAGVVGLSTVAALRAAGAEVTCFERGPAVMGERSAGSTRIFRLAHEDPALVRLARWARAIFGEWESAAGRRMIGPEGCVVSGTAVAGMAAGLRAAGARSELVEPAGAARLRLPAREPPAVSLIDPEGGITDVDAVRAHLGERAADVLVHEPVRSVEPHGAGAVVRSASGSHRFDAVVVAAGAGTPALVGSLGLDVPSTLAHHVRFTLPDPGAPPDRPCWIDDPAGGLHTYQHRSGPRQWTVGASMDPALVAWEVGREAAEAASRRAVLAHVRERLTVEPRIVGSLYCTTTAPPQGDGFVVQRTGSVLAVHGANLFKLAPVVGRALAAAAVDGSTPSAASLAASAG
ncbi:NAD(P)/FAD-dependent oxidoreductase [Pseudonocardia sp.]|uniref:NAD(P)/FAD-dependent oxidoreductase n=1 Tax=Pseudonocardia sp. TaxID=60912 RepID=UPI003D0E3226